MHFNARLKFDEPATTVMHADDIGGIVDASAHV